jgi:hypothetical protein
MKHLGLLLLGFIIGIAAYQLCKHYEHTYTLEDRV